ncbi:MAG: RtcB family protein [Candidatus Goldbacteria bacterium]|nr:RtcB family protein [Candidatus Goldiibacteriota bacterium]
MKKISDYKFEIEKKHDMNVPGIIYASEKLLKDIGNEPLMQVENVACLPGIQKYSIAMPDIHWGYGFPIGGVAAFDYDDGIISPGGVGYDINCGVRMIKTNLDYDEIRDKIDDLANGLFNAVPSGVGSSGAIVLTKKELFKVLKKGLLWAVSNGYGSSTDVNRAEEGGVLNFDSDTDDVSSRAIERGLDQLGTLGAGNHFLEIQKVDTVFLPSIADKLGIFKNQIIIMFHTGSRGLGYQICDDYLHLFRSVFQKYGIKLKDQQLISVPITSKEGKKYFNAMSGAANYAWANRQVITGLIENTFENFFKKSASSLGISVIYDVSHNIARMEEHEVDGKMKKLCVHRKGATRALPKGHEMLPEELRDIGQPVLVPGDMGRASFILKGEENSKEAFYSCAHGAGRMLSRSQALKQGRNRNLFDEIAGQGVVVKVRSKKLLAEEAPFAYKDAEDITGVVQKAGLASRVAKLKPVAVIKG